MATEEITETKTEPTIEEKVEALKQKTLNNLSLNSKKMHDIQAVIAKRRKTPNKEIPLEITQETMADIDALESIKNYYLDIKQQVLAEKDKINRIRFIKRIGLNNTANKCQTVADLADKMIEIINQYETELQNLGVSPKKKTEEQGNEQELNQEKETQQTIENDDNSKKNTPKKKKPKTKTVHTKEVDGDAKEGDKKEGAKKENDAKEGDAKHEPIVEKEDDNASKKIEDETIHTQENESGDNTDGGDTNNNKPNPKKTGLLDGIPKKYYKPIFKLINNTIVLGNKDKFNTLENLEYQLQNADVAKLQELGIPVTNNPEKAELIRKIALKFVKASKEIRKDQWLSALDSKKKGKFEARKHTTEEAIIDRNEKLLRRFNISRNIAKQYGLSLSQEDIQKKNNDNTKTRTHINKVKENSTFIEFYNKVKSTYHLGNTSNDNLSLNNIYKDLTSGNNSYGLSGDELKAAISFIQREIIIRRSTYKSGKTESKKAIDKEKTNLGLEQEK